MLVMTSLAKIIGEVLIKRQHEEISQIFNRHFSVWIRFVRVKEG